MKFGVEENEKGTLCANCKTLLSEQDALQANFCSHCGAPLKQESIDTLLKLERSIQKDTVLQIEEALKTYSIEKIVADLKEQFKTEE